VSTSSAARTPAPRRSSEGRAARRRAPQAGRAHWRADLFASLVVFLVALPLCIGIAVASGVPAELGLITGVVGGLVTGAMRGSHLQVSGPAAGLTVLVYETVHSYGLQSLGVITLAAGLAQLAMAALRLGRWFRAISSAVVLGMLTGIGLVIVLQQTYALLDRPQQGSTLANLGGLPGLLRDVSASGPSVTAGVLGLGTIAVILLWPRLPVIGRLVPGALVAVVVSTGVVALADLPVATLEINGLLAAIDPTGLADLSRLTEVGVLGAVVAFALIASAETLFCAAAVDRMAADRGRSEQPTNYERELLAQGAGNAVCGVLGALPVTAVIVRSAANLEAGARTRASRVLHGLWLLLFVAAVPGLLGLVPLCVLAGILVHAGLKLVAVKDCRRLWRSDRGEVLVLLATAAAIVATNLFEGVLLGLLLALVKTAWDVSHLHIDVDTTEPVLRVALHGNATFLKLPEVIDTLDGLPPHRTVRLDLSGLRHLDEACRSALVAWAARREAGEGGVDVDPPLEPPRQRRVAAGSRA
jgi:MFS superfamily sulfate permease-like transporter